MDLWFYERTNYFYSVKSLFRVIAVFIFCSTFSIHSLAQGPQVPSKMEFAGLKLKIQESGRKDIQESVDMLTRSSTHYNAMIEKARSYFPIIERIFKEENLPEDFKYLVLQESALIPDAVSSSNAVGYWQFKDFTAIEMGMRVDRNIDERKNIVSATRAAAKYLKLNNTYFDNWLHALQAYQMGAGGAMRVLDDKSGVNTMTIDKNTYWYVKKFLAHKVAYENVTESEPQLKLSEYTNSAGKNLNDIAKEVNIDYESLEAYNKWLQRGRIPDDKIYTVVIPSEQYIKSKQVEPVIAKTSDPEPAEELQIQYTFVDRDLFPRIVNESNGFAEINGLPAIIAQKETSLSALATRADLSLKKLLKYNDISIDYKVQEGDYFYIKKKRAKAPAYYHVLQPGESLWDVAQNYSLRLKRLKHKNRIREDNPDLKAGRVMWLRYVRPDHVPIEYREVKAQAKKEVEASKNVTPKTEPKALQDSVILGVYPLDIPKGEEEEIEKTEPVDNITYADHKKLDSIRHIHRVEPGETYYAIANKYNASVIDVLMWNELNIKDKLAIGQELVVYEHKPASIDNLDQSEKTKPEETSFIYYTVQPGDTMYKIARNHELTVEELMNLNEKSDFSLNLGDKIKVGKKEVIK